MADSVAPVVVGLDLSIAATGVATPHGVETIKLAAKLGDSRLQILADKVEELVVPRIPAPYLPAELVVIEGYVTRSPAASVLGLVHGAVRTRLLDLGVPYLLVPPATLKKYATGKGTGDKTAMAIAALKRAGREFGDDNQCDAWWLSVLGLDLLGHPIVDIPKTQRAAIQGLQLPVKETL